jgi:putative nucleotidyltransferase with HDIG domain
MEEETLELRASPSGLVLERGQKIPSYLDALGDRRLQSFLLLPIFLKGNLYGTINLGFRTAPMHSPEQLLHLHQVADQIAVALSNARLMEELEELNWGTLTALARAIDAKSPWTAGHSERVTKVAVEIGRAMGLPQRELTILHRGGLVHDIGKIGTPPEILDKAGKLSAEELQVMRDHVRLGARILEPIPALAEAIPIVLEHHEWFNGSGYPAGLRGEQISLHARIFAVADCFDALVSDRPYRAGLPRAQVIEIIQQGSGRQYDPEVIEAFLRVMAEQEGEMIHVHAADAG